MGCFDASSSSTRSPQNFCNHRSAWIIPNVVFFFQLAEPIRILLEYVGESYEDKRYEIGSSKLRALLTSFRNRILCLLPVAPETLRKEWLEVKYKLGLDFPNVSNRNAVLICNLESIQRIQLL